MSAASRGSDSGERGRRLLEGLFIPLVVALMAGAAWYASRPRIDEPRMDLPDFSLPGIELQASVELPRTFAPLRTRPAPRLELAQDTERVIVEVRQALLESSTRDRDAVPAIPLRSGAESLEIGPDRLAVR